MSGLCKESKDKEKHDHEKAMENKEEGKKYYKCKKCKRLSHKEDHLCKPEKVD